MELRSAECGFRHVELKDATCDGRDFWKQTKRLNLIWNNPRRGFGFGNNSRRIACATQV